MSDQLKAIIEKIKVDGIRNANDQASEIISKAKKEAKQIVADAEKQKQDIIESAKKNTAVFEENSKAALVQAGRDLIIYIQKQLALQYDALIREQVDRQYKADIIPRVIGDIMKNWSASEYKTLDILLSKKDLSALKDSLGKALADQLASGMTLKADSKISSGFRITEKNGSYYYDFSSESIADLFSEFLTDSLTEVLKKAAGENKQ